MSKENQPKIPTRITAPRTFDDLAAVLQITGNCTNRYAGINTEQGKALYSKILALERRLSPLLYRRQPEGTALPHEAYLDVEELLYLMQLLSRNSVGYILRGIGVRKHRRVEELMPEVIAKQHTETAY